MKLWLTKLEQEFGQIVVTNKNLLKYKYLDDENQIEELKRQK